MIRRLLEYSLATALDILGLRKTPCKALKKVVRVQGGVFTANTVVRDPDVRLRYPFDPEPYKHFFMLVESYRKSQSSLLLVTADMDKHVIRRVMLHEGIKCVLEYVDESKNIDYIVDGASVVEIKPYMPDMYILAYSVIGNRIYLGFLLNKSWYSGRLLGKRGRFPVKR